MKMKTFPALPSRLTLALVAGAALLGGCASTGPNSPSARPVLYPNAAYNRIGEAAARTETDACLSKAQAAGLHPQEDNNSVARDAGKGAAVTGVAAAVGALVTGRGLEGAVRSGVGGAAVGGAAGAVAGAYQSRPSTTYRHFVQRCLSEKGLDLIGWN